MDNPTIGQQFKRNFVAILSLVVALSGLAYNTWRNERTEQNRNVRVAAFEILKTLGELQLIVDYAHFRKNERLGDSTLGWGKVLFIKDLAEVVPAPASDDAERLLATWRAHWEKIESDNEGALRVSEDIHQARRNMVDILHRLR